MERARSQDDVSQNFSAAAAAGKRAQKSSQQRLQMVPEFADGLPGSLLVPGPIPVAGVQLSAGQEVALGGSGLFALYWAEVRPSVKRVALSERAKVHILSLDSDAFNIPSLGGKKAKSGNFGSHSFDEMCFFSPDFSS